MKKKPGKKKLRPWVRPLIAVVGFFAFLFLGAYFLHLFHARWIIPVTVIVAIAWAVFFAVRQDEDDEK